MSEFKKFLNQFRCEKGQPSTHTTMGKGAGSYNIPRVKATEFFQQYTREMVRPGALLHLTEKPTDPSPMRADLDFRFAMPTDGIVRRSYTPEDVTRIVARYSSVLAEYVAPTDDAPLIAYVMEKPEAVEYRGKMKDGIHIVWPHQVLSHNVQHLIRKRVLDTANELFLGMNICNDYGDVIDKAIIDKNNWQMYGSSKPDSEAYRVTSIYQWTGGVLSGPPSPAPEPAAAAAAAGAAADERASSPTIAAMIQRAIGHLERLPAPSATEELSFPELFSMRYKDDMTSAIRAEKVAEVNEYIRHVLPNTDEKRMNKLKAQIFGKSINNIRIFAAEEELALARLLVKECLSTRRAENYEDWIKCGWALRNIDYRLLETWIEFSSVSSKYVEGQCQLLWDNMRADTLGMGTLRWWAKQDNPIRFNEIMDRDVYTLIDRCIGTDGAHFDVAKVVHAMYKDRYRFTMNDTWYTYQENKHRWVRNKEGLKLRMVLSNDVCRKFSDRSMYWTQEGIKSNEHRDTYEEKAKKLMQISVKLKTSGYKDSVMKECKCMFTDEHFDELLDSHPHLIGFENGVYDLRMHEFRDGLPDDYISFSTGRYYTPYNPLSDDAKDIHVYLAQVFTNEAVRKYMMDLFACVVDGSIRQEKFYVFTGSGSNSKSLSLQLFQKAVGEYYCILPIALLTQKRTASNSAQAELERTKGRRIAVMQEPGESEKLNIGLMKELSGGDIIQCRGLFKEPIEFRPQFKMIMTCNELPEVPSDDGGTWRRIRVIEFTSKFTDTPDPNNPKEFPVDPDLVGKLDRWADTFISMILDHHSRMDIKSITEPMEVRIATESYKKNNDVIGQFVADCIRYNPDSNDRLQLQKALAQFKLWAYNVIPKGKKVPDRNQFKAYMEKTYGVYPPNSKGWLGLRYVNPELDEGEDDEDPLNDPAIAAQLRTPAAKKAAAKKAAAAAAAATGAASTSATPTPAAAAPAAPPPTQNAAPPKVPRLADDDTAPAAPASPPPPTAAPPPAKKSRANAKK